jgi:hypothetical protein
VGFTFTPLEAVGNGSFQFRLRADHVLKGWRKVIEVSPVYKNRARTPGGIGDEAVDLMIQPLHMVLASIIGAAGED